LMAAHCFYCFDGLICFSLIRFFLLLSFSLSFSYVLFTT